MAETFSPDWLTRRLGELVPQFPHVSLCVALSGGLDSTVLLAALAAHKGKHPEVRAIHVDHGIHPDSAKWSAHCRALGRALHVPVQVLTTKVERARGVSLEAAARDERYRLLAQELREDEVLLTAHHEDDQLETVLLQLFRGCGLAGLSAMPAVARFANGWHVRPLLSRSRAELDAWGREHELTWVEDATNADERLDRNYLRRRVLPLVRERWTGVGAAVGRSARHAAEAQRLLDALARVDAERAGYGESLSVKSLRALSPDRRRNALRYWISQSGHPVPDTKRLEEIAGPLFEARPDANPLVEWAGIQLQRHADLLTLRATRRPTHGTGERGARSQARYDRLRADPARAVNADPVLARADSRRTAVPSTHAPDAIVWQWRSSPSCDLPSGFGQLELKRDARGPVDLDKLPELLTVRWRRGGEKIRPRQGGPRRALKSLLQEAHVPVAERSRLPLICVAEDSGDHRGNQLIAVADLYVDESVQASPSAPRRARLVWKK